MKAPALLDNRKSFFFYHYGNMLKYWHIKDLIAFHETLLHAFSRRITLQFASQMVNLQAPLCAW